METVRIDRINNFEYSFGLSNKYGIKAVSKALTFRNPDPYAYTQNIEKFNKRRLTFRIGMLQTLLKYLRDKDISYSLRDYSYSIPENVSIDDRMSGKYDYQRRAVEAFYRRRFGIIAVPTRGGKTFIAAEILRIFLETDSGNFLFLTDNTTLFTQAIDDIHRYFERYGGIEIGEIRAGSVDTSKRVTVGMIQTIQSAMSDRCSDREKKGAMKRYLRELRFLCVDEIHDNCSDSKLRIYKRCVGLEYQLCLSATPYRANALVQNLKLREWSGDIVYDITEEELRDVGVLSDYRVIMLMVDHEGHDDGVDDRDYADVRRRLMYENERRNGVLRTTVETMRDMRLKTLVLFQSVEHGRLMSEMLGETFISGETSGEDREAAKRAFLDADGGVLLASGIFKKGVTLPEVQVLVNADGGLEDALVIQRKGRVLGATEGKSRSLVVDVLDVYGSYLGGHSERRMDTYLRSVGERGVTVLDTDDTSWSETMRSATERWIFGK